MRITVSIGCPAGHADRRVAVIETDSWWGKGVTPARVAAQALCRECGAPGIVLACGVAELEAPVLEIAPLLEGVAWW